jgi:TolB-like protein
MEESTRGIGRARAISNVHFGPFDLDVEARELRKAGRRMRLQEQPFQILLMLLELPGGVVLREEICSRLWPNDTVVEFDHSINAAVKRLRDALRDSAKKPRYIQTVARRGYRFVCAVERPEGELARTSGQPALAEDTPSIAVLPFTDMSRDKENEYFSDGLAEEIINKLTRVPGLKVIARTSAFSFKGKQKDIREIAQALGVTNILEGSVRRAGSRLRIIAQLVAAADGSHLWSEAYDREMADIFTVQDEIAQAISSALQVRLSGRPRQYAPQLPAYEAYLKARHCISTFTREALTRSREFFQLSLALDPGFAEAHSGLALSLFTSVFPGLAPAHEAMPLARAAAQRALELDPASQEAQGVLGMIAAVYDFDWKTAERQFALAMARELAPPYVRAYYAFYLVSIGRLQEACTQCERGLRNDPLSLLVRFHYAIALLAGGEDAAGEAQLRELSAFYPNLYQSFYLLGVSQALQGLHADAFATAETAWSLAPWNTGVIGLFAGALACTGQAQRAQELLQELAPVDRYGTPLGRLIYHLMREEVDEAARWGRKVLEQRDPRLTTIIALLRSPSRNVIRSNRSWSSLTRSLRVPLEC